MMNVLTRIEYFRYDADAIRTARDAAGLSQAAVAKACGVNVRTVGRIELGIAGSEPTVRAVCAVVGLIPEKVITPVEHPGREFRGRRKNLPVSST